MSTATDATKAPPDLQIKGRTAIVSFRRHCELWDNGEIPRSIADVLTKAAALAKGLNDRRDLSAASFHVVDLTGGSQEGLWRGNRGPRQSNRKVTAWPFLQTFIAHPANQPCIGLDCLDWGADFFMNTDHHCEYGI